MKRILAFFLMVIYLNAAVIPQLPEIDMFDNFGNQKDDINSLAEYIGVVIGLDNTADDEDNDNGQAFVFVKTINYSCESPISYLMCFNLSIPYRVSYTLYQYPRLSIPIVDINTPPPDFNI